MRTLNLYPPNWDLIKIVFPKAEGTKTIFCYGNTIYNPFDIKITPDLEAHEEVHVEQQGNDPDAWWTKYISDPQFRTEQEIEAYGVQLSFAKKNGVSGKLLYWLEDKLADALSGDVYGNLLTFGEAKSKIKNFSKNLKS